jgi:hypothetical protein
LPAKALAAYAEVIYIPTHQSGEIPLRVFDAPKAGKQWLESLAQLKST